MTHRLHRTLRVFACFAMLASSISFAEARERDSFSRALVMPFDTREAGVEPTRAAAWAESYVQALNAPLGGGTRTRVGGLGDEEREALSNLGLQARDCGEACALDVARDVCANVVVSGRVAKDGTGLRLELHARWTRDGATVSKRSARVASAADMEKALATLASPQGPEITAVLSQSWPQDTPALDACPGSAVRFITEPAGAEILLDGRSLGSAPVTVFVDPGAHDLVVRKPWLQTQRIRKMIRNLKEIQTVSLALAPDSPTAGMSLVPAGTFQMGNPATDAPKPEKPVRKVTLSKAYWMDRTEVLAVEFDACIAAGACDPARGMGQCGRSDEEEQANRAQRPETCVSFMEATAYCAWRGKRLPTEAEWERAARGGLEGKRYTTGDDTLGAEAWFGGNAGYGVAVHAVATKKPNGYGLYDMLGNVAEWVADPYDPRAYQRLPTSDPVVRDKPERKEHIIRDGQPDTFDDELDGSWAIGNPFQRGGSFIAEAQDLGVARRMTDEGDGRPEAMGFRCAMSVDAPVLAYVPVEIHSDPPGALLTVGKAKAQWGPLYLRLPPGEVVVTASFEGYADVRKAVRLEKGPAAQQVQLQLTPKSPRTAMIRLPAGSFWMGSTQGAYDERPARQVVFTEAYWLDATEVTVEAYRRVMMTRANRAKHGSQAADDDEDSAGDGEGSQEAPDDEAQDEDAPGRSPAKTGAKDDECNRDAKGRQSHPVNCISRKSAEDFCKRVGKRLPTEAEWERAARGGLEQKKYPWGDATVPPKEAGNLADAALAKVDKKSDVVASYDDGFAWTSPAGSYPPNALGFFDLGGNVSELIGGGYLNGLYGDAPRFDPETVRGAGPAPRGSITRGGSCSTDLATARVASRNRVETDQGEDAEGYGDVGFRCAMGGAPGRPAGRGLVLAVRPDPGDAFVEVDGHHEGKGPVVVPITPGPHTVRAWSRTHDAKSVTVQVVAGGAPQVVELGLTRQTGRLLVAGVLPDGKPWVGATVLVDRKEVGKMPWEGAVETGWHTVAVRQGGISLESSPYVYANGSIPVAFGNAPGTAPGGPGSTAGMVKIPAGTFQMGTDWSTDSDASPQHATTLTRAYFMDDTEVTTGAYSRCVKAKKCKRPNGGKPCEGFFRSVGDATPQACVSWHQAKAYCTWMGKRLPTEAEWERAARGGLEGRLYPSGDDPALDQVYFVDAGVGRPNAFGLYAMSGNLFEWVEDAYDPKAYSTLPATDPVATNGKLRVVRGGASSGDERGTTVFARAKADPATPNGNVVGFRCVKSE